VAEIVKRQAQTGIDIVNDGEFGKSTSWSLYALKRLSGFELRPFQPGADTFARGADRQRFPEFYAELEGRPTDRTWSKVTVQDAVCVGPIQYTGVEELQRDINNLKAGLSGVQVEEAFLPVAAPSSAMPDRKNEYYRNDEELVLALAEALRTEYRTIAQSGILLQVDDARAAVTYDRMVPPASFGDYYRWLGRHVEVLNHALAGIPEDRIRYHVCWGSWPGPHTSDVPLKKIKYGLARTSSKPRIPATSTSGRFGRVSGCPKARCWRRALSATERTWWNIRSWWRSGYSDSPAWWAVRTSSQAPIAVSPRRS
jgi:5-methyltetrahydropteroyltriglutamate--homocysteine methyltransferase